MSCDLDVTQSKFTMFPALSMTRTVTNNDAEAWAAAKSYNTPQFACGASSSRPGTGNVTKR